MWFDIIKDNGSSPCIVVDVTKTERKFNLDSSLLNENGVTNFILDEARLYSDISMCKKSGYVSFDYLEEGIIQEIKIPCEAIVVVYSKAAKIHSGLFNELLLFHSDDGVMFDLDDAETDAKPYSADVIPIGSRRQ